MAILEDLKQSISEMTEEQLYTLLREVRSNRTSYRPKAKAAKKAPKKKDSIADLLGALDATQLAGLIEKLGGKKDE